MQSSHRTLLFPGVSSLVTALYDRELRVAVVTSSVSYYAEHLLSHHGLRYDTLVAYHDAAPRKPAPSPFQEALSRLGLTANEALGVGDGPEDAAALSAAGISGFAAAWSPTVALDAPWEGQIHDPADLLDLIT